ncbi:MAG: HD-GYP domain-containing protein [Isosphaeraceae bacterium]|nr:HD-GYP domain-containing protein [Isosphaeraceae bacterium]
MHNAASVLSTIERPLTAITSDGDAAWNALERFLQQLEGGRLAPDQYATTLGAIREATGAAVVFLYSPYVDGVLESVGNPAPTPHWCREFSRALAVELPQGGLWRAPDFGSRPVFAEGVPLATAVMLPVEAPRPAFLIALGPAAGPPLQESDLRVLRVIWRLQLGHGRHVRLYDKLKETLFGIVRCLSTAIDAKDSLTSGHSERVARIAVRLGEEMKLSRGEISDLYLAGLLHDVGKIGIRDDVLMKPGPLTPIEAAHMREHPVLGERIIESVTRLAYLCPAVRGHHERYDGKGYPDGLAGDAIPQMARILAVADACDAMMSDRRYRGALSPDRIEETFRNGAGTAWDARIVHVFFACRLELYAICQRGLGQSVYMAVERAAGGDASGSRVGSRIHRRVPAGLQ